MTSDVTSIVKKTKTVCTHTHKHKRRKCNTKRNKGRKELAQAAKLKNQAKPKQLTKSQMMFIRYSKHYLESCSK